MSSLLPAALTAQLGEEAKEGLETAAVYVFARPDGTRTKGSIWLVRGGQCFCLAAVSGAEFWSFRVEGKGQVELLPGLTRDSVRVGPYSVPLALRTRESAARLVEGYDARATEVRPEAERPSVPRAAIGHALPDWWTEVVGQEPDDPWLLGIETASSWPRLSATGAVKDRPLVLGLSRRRLCLAAGAEDPEPFWTEVWGPAERIERLGRDTVRLDSWSLSIRDREAELVARVADADGAHRVGLVFEYLLAQGALPAAEGLLDQVSPAGAWSPLALPLSACAWHFGEPNAAFAWLAQAERLPEQTEAVAGVRAVGRQLAATKAEAQSDLQKKLTRLAPPEVPYPEGFPWPPITEAELFWAARAVRGQADPSLDVDRKASPRLAHVRASIRRAKASEWREVAEAHAEAGNFEAAREAAQSATRADGAETQDFLRHVAWAWRAGVLEDAHAALTSAVGSSIDDSTLEVLLVRLPDPAPADERASSTLGTLGRWVGLSPSSTGSDAHLDLADAALGAGAKDVAARLLVDRERRAASSPAEVEKIAERCAIELASPRAAALLLEGLAERLEAADDGDPAACWHAAAAHRARAGDATVALRDLRAAVSADFLHPDRYQTALALEGVARPPLLQTWWQHIQAILQGGEVLPPGLDPSPPLTSEALDALHPGGVGWLARVQSAVKEAPPPSRHELIRGLEPLSMRKQPEVAAALEDVSRGLGVAAPETFLYRGPDAFGTSAWPLDPPVLLLGFEHLEPGGPRALTPDALRFTLAVELTHLACNHPLLSFEADLLGTSHSAYQALGRFAGTAETVVDLVTLLPGVDQLAKLQRVVQLSRRVFSAKSTMDKVGSLTAPLAKLFERAGPEGIGRSNLEGTALQFRVQADRAALLLTGHLGAAVESMLKSSPRSLGVLDRVRSEGLAAVLQDAKSLTPDEVLRLSGLLSFAARELPEAASSGARPTSGPEGLADG